jgi:hypothetical protein
VDLTLSVGAVTQTVEVIGEAPAIETTTATLSGLVNAERIRELDIAAFAKEETRPALRWSIEDLFGAAGAARINVFTADPVTQRLWLELLLGFSDKEIAALLRSYYGALEFSEPDWFPAFLFDNFREMYRENDTAPQPITTISSTLRTLGWADLRLGPVLVETPDLPVVDVTGFNPVNGVAAADFVRLLQEKIGEVRNIRDEQGNIMPNRLSIVATEAALLRGIGNFGQRGDLDDYQDYIVYRAGIAAGTLIFWAGILQKLFKVDERFKGVLGFPAPKDAELIGKALRAEGLHKGDNHISWFFTGALAKFLDAAGNNFDGNSSHYSDDQPIVLNDKTLQNDSRFATWHINLGWGQAAHRDNSGGLVFEACWAEASKLA